MAWNYVTRKEEKETEEKVVLYRQYLIESAKFFITKYSICLISALGFGSIKGTDNTKGNISYSMVYLILKTQKMFVFEFLLSASQFLSPRVCHCAYKSRLGILAKTDPIFHAS